MANCLRFAILAPFSSLLLVFTPVEVGKINFTVPFHFDGVPPFDTPHLHPNRHLVARIPTTPSLIVFV